MLNETLSFEIKETAEHDHDTAEDNIAAAELTLSEEEYLALEAAAS